MVSSFAQPDPKNCRLLLNLSSTIFYSLNYQLDKIKEACEYYLNCHNDYDIAFCNGIYFGIDEDYYMIDIEKFLEGLNSKIEEDKEDGEEPPEYILEIINNQ